MERHSAYIRAARVGVGSIEQIKRGYPSLQEKDKLDMLTHASLRLEVSLQVSDDRGIAAIANEGPESGVEQNRND